MLEKRTWRNNGATCTVLRSSLRCVTGLGLCQLYRQPQNMVRTSYYENELTYVRILKRCSISTFSVWANEYPSVGRFCKTPPRSLLALFTFGHSLPPWPSMPLDTQPQACSADVSRRVSRAPPAPWLVTRIASYVSFLSREIPDAVADLVSGSGSGPCTSLSSSDSIGTLDEGSGAGARSRRLNPANSASWGRILPTWSSSGWDESDRRKDETK